MPRTRITAANRAEIIDLAVTRWIGNSRLIMVSNMETGGENRPASWEACCAKYIEDATIEVLGAYRYENATLAQIESIYPAADYHAQKRAASLYRAEIPWVVEWARRIQAAK
jgi:hypothetical protein